MGHKDTWAYKSGSARESSWASSGSRQLCHHQGLFEATSIHIKCRQWPRSTVTWPLRRRFLFPSPSSWLKSRSELRKVMREQISSTTSNLLILVFYFCVINHYMFSSLKQHPFTCSQFGSLETWGRCDWILYLGAKSWNQGIGLVDSWLEALGKNWLPSSCRLLSNSVPCNYRTEVSLLCKLSAQGCSQHPAAACIPGDVVPSISSGSNREPFTPWIPLRICLCLPCLWYLDPELISQI